MRVLITGGLGFIGTNLVDFWINSNTDSVVTVYDDVTYAANTYFLKEKQIEYGDRLNFIKANLASKKDIQQAVDSSDVVYHLAAETYGSLEPGSTEVFTEESKTLPQSVYAATKCADEHLAYCMRYLYDIDVAVVRLFNNFGPRQHPEKVIPRFICRAINDLPLEIAGKFTRF